ncbi:hypothetical protein JNJ66_06055 [Candidatus Saccharibacteria bacterium]|nr:hypothetical protein [Candidatus Saccharibacteria bacterium]
MVSSGNWHYDDALKQIARLMAAHKDSLTPFIEVELPDVLAASARDITPDCIAVLREELEYRAPGWTIRPAIPELYDPPLPKPTYEYYLVAMCPAGTPEGAVAVRPAGNIRLVAIQRLGRQHRFYDAASEAVVTQRRLASGSEQQRREFDLHMRTVVSRHVAQQAPLLRERAASANDEARYDAEQYLAIAEDGRKSSGDRLLALFAAATLLDENPPRAALPEDHLPATRR